ncbi:DUF4397 domain-containing protein [Peribacillus sp. NPDC097295]|uniref:DUF4397 domain-containing protein n=1 Tax=Peribacillus sp. NPDC097295 TaxID=3364402 RepID=UPI003801FFD7
MKNKHTHLQKAMNYDALSCYYKYSNPHLHDYYYHKHLKSMEKAIQPMRNGQMISLKPAKVRVFHAAPKAPAVDVYVNEMRILQNFAYKNKSDYLSLPPGKYQVDIYPTGQTTSTLLSRKLDVESEKMYTVVAAGSNEMLKLLTFEDNPYVPQGESKIRFVHLSFDTPPVDIAVKDGDVVFSNLSYRKASEYLNLYPMHVDFEVRLAGSKEAALSLPTDIQADTPLSIYIVGSSQGEPGLEVITLSP